MLKIKETDIFHEWLTNLKNVKGKVKIINRIKRLKRGNKGDWKTIDKDIYELRIHFGPGYRVYYTNRKNEIILLLIAGDNRAKKKT